MIVKVRDKFFSLSRGKQIALFVCSFHLLILFALLANHWLSRRMKAVRPITVRTVIPQAPALAAPIKAAPTKAVTKKAAPAKVAPAAVAASASAGKKAAPLPSVKKLPVPKDESLLREIAGHLEAFQEAKNGPKKELPVPAKVESKAAAPVVAPVYGEFLIGYLQEALELPEYGEVKAKLEIDRFGKLIACEIVEAKSAKNAEFLKNRLPELPFPCLNDFDILETTQTFTITFRNVEIR